jgi:predicted DNA-binding transcriptional regulator AlpA
MTAEIDTSPLLTSKEVAAWIRLSDRTLQQLRVNRRGPKYTKAGTRVLYRASDVAAWLQERGTTDQP